MSTLDERATVRRRAKRRERTSWADVGSFAPSHEGLRPYVESITSTIGCLREREARFITRAYPTVMTSLYVELCGDLSEVRDARGAFALSRRAETATTSIRKGTYLKHGLGSWFDIHQLSSDRESRPIRNLKIDLHPGALYRLFRLSPQELTDEDVQLTDLMGATNGQLMLDELESADTGEQLTEIVERYLFRHLLDTEAVRALDRQAVPSLPTLDTTLGGEAQRHAKSERWLQNRYAQVYGMSFKQMQKNLRFHQAHRLLSQAIARSRPISLTELAMRVGYFDQAHFIKDFKRYTGMTPGRYLRAHVEPEQRALFYW